MSETTIWIVTTRHQGMSETKFAVLAHDTQSALEQAASWVFENWRIVRLEDTGLDLRRTEKA